MSDSQLENLTVDLEQFLLINKIVAANFESFGWLKVTKFSNKNRMMPSRFQCPFCGSHELAFYENGGITKWKCDCFNGQTKTNADIFAKIFNLDVSRDRDEIYRRVTEKISVDNIQRQSSPKPAPSLDLSDDEIAQLARDKIAAVQGTLRNLPKSELRGFDGDDGIAFLESFKIGVDLKWTHPKMPNSRSTKRFVMPLGDKDNHISYNAIMTHEDRQRYKTLREGNNPPKWSEKCLTAGAKLVFNPSALNDPRIVVPLFEGEFDALAVMYSSNGTIPACALGGAGLYGDLINRLQNMEQRPYILIINDNDKDKEINAGQVNAQRGLKKLANIRVAAVSRYFEQYMTPEDVAKVGGKVDANAIMQTLGKKYLCNLVMEIITDVADELEHIAEEYAAMPEPSNDATNFDLALTTIKSQRNGEHSGNKRPEIQALLDKINSDLTAGDLEAKNIIVKSKRQYYCCPFCESGNRTHGTGALQIYDGNGFFCHSCGEGGSFFKLITTVRNLNTYGKDFFETLRAVADEFDVKYDPKIFEMPSPKAEEQPAKVEIPTFVTASEDKVADWLSVNGGVIEPNMVNALRSAEKFFAEVTPEKITPEFVNSSVTLQNLALVTFYDFMSANLNKFFTALESAAENAANQIAEAKTGMVEKPSDEVVEISKLRKYKLESSIKTRVTAIRKAHKNFVADFKEKYERAERQARQKAAREADKAAIGDAYKLKDPAQAEYLLAQLNDDTGRAEQFAYLFGNHIRFMPSREQWLAYQRDKEFKNSGVWRLGNPGKNTIVMPFAAEMHKFIIANAPENPDPEFDKSIQNWRNLKCMTNAVRLAGSSNRNNIQITAADLDTHPQLLLCRNGVIDLQTKRFYPRVDPRLLITKRCNAIYNPDADDTFVWKFLCELLPDEGTLAAVLRYIAYCFTGEISQQKIHFWKGEGANGKSTLLATLLYLLGDYGVKVASDIICESDRPTDANSATPALASLIGARAAISNELKGDSRIDARMVKDLTSGEPLPVRLLHCNVETFKPICKLIICGNFYPSIDNVDDKGLRRRIQTVEFTQTFEGGRADLQLPEKLLLEENLSALLNLIVENAFEFYRDGTLLESTAMSNARNIYLDSNDFVAMFVEEYCIRKANCHVLAKKLIDKFEAVYPAQYHRNKKGIRKAVEDKFITSKRKTKYGIEYTGIGLVETPPGGDDVDPDNLPPNI